ncbi:MAG: hypothetical protein IBX67_05830 [Dehalococcoidia bacterium]|nr:hypothetical protein [Dehalococcoidia bacterium]
MEILRCKDKDGITIICSQDTWDNHIVSGHPEVKGCEMIVKTAIEKPFQVYQDGRHANRRIIYKPFVLPKPFHTQYLRIAIEYHRGKVSRNMQGYVCSAFACQTKRKGDILIWEGQL